MHIQAPASFTCTWMRSIADNKFSTFEMRIDSLEENQIYSNINLMCLSVYILTLISFQVKHWRWFGIIAFIPRSWRWCSWRLSSFSHSNPCAKTASHSPLTLWSNTKSSMIGKKQWKNIWHDSIMFLLCPRPWWSWVKLFSTHWGLVEEIDCYSRIWRRLCQPRCQCFLKNLHLSMFRCTS